MAPDLIIGIGLLLLLSGTYLAAHHHQTRRHRTKRSAPQMMRGISAAESSAHTSIFDPPIAPSTALPAYALIDLQTTGLDAESDRVLQVSWLVIDASYRCLRRGTHIIYQEHAGSLEARRIHRMSEHILQRYGRVERDVTAELWAAISDAPLLVGHHIAFDVAFLDQLLQRHLPDASAILSDLDTLCTMESSGGGAHTDQHPYLSLLDLSARVITEPYTEEAARHPVSWRNVCLTRQCLMHIQQHPNHIL